MSYRLQLWKNSRPPILHTLAKGKTKLSDLKRDEKQKVQGNSSEWQIFGEILKWKIWNTNQSTSESLTQISFQSFAAEMFWLPDNLLEVSIWSCSLC